MRSFIGEGLNTHVFSNTRIQTFLGVSFDERETEITGRLRDVTVSKGRDRDRKESRRIKSSKMHE
jgi:hypothetical protein